jgi:hypothetical protein
MVNPNRHPRQYPSAQETHVRVVLTAGGRGQPAASARTCSKISDVSV